MGTSILIGPWAVIRLCLAWCSGRSCLASRTTSSTSPAAGQSDLVMEMRGNQRQAQQQFDILLLLRILIVELQPVVKVLVYLVVWLTCDRLPHLPFFAPVSCSALALAQHVFSRPQGALTHVVHIEIATERLLFLNKLLEVLFSERPEVVGNLCFLILKLLAK